MTSSPAALAPGAWIGIFGGGQLGRMLVMEARRMGYATCVLDPDPTCPAGQVADEQLVAAYDNLDMARALARRADVITFEFEHVDAEAVAAAEQMRSVYPSSRVLRVVQHRVRQKQALRNFGAPLPEFRIVETRQDLDISLASIGLPAVLKTATLGYDGKGQAVIHSPADAHAAYSLLRPRSEVLVMEEYVAFSKEISVICARDINGGVTCYPVVENVHRDGILDVTIAPARIDPAVAAAAQDLARGIIERLGVVGVLCVEMFLTEEGRLLINEVAPRPHNSGHYSLDACPTSQFEQLLRVLCRLPMGIPDLLSPTVMVNLLGDLWVEAEGQLNFAAALEVPGVRLHLYGKRDARPGRKMGHLCALAPTVEAALERALTARAAITATA